MAQIPQIFENPTQATIAGAGEFLRLFPAKNNFETKNKSPLCGRGRFNTLYANNVLDERRLRFSPTANAKCKFANAIHGNIHGKEKREQFRKETT